MGRCGIQRSSWSFAAAMRLPVKVMNPRITSAMMAPVRKGVSASGPSAYQE
jgi:hypothetical protein